MTATGPATRHIARWRRDSARLAVLLAAPKLPPELVREAFALQRQCEDLAARLQHARQRAGHERG